MTSPNPIRYGLRWHRQLMPPFAVTRRRTFAAKAPQSISSESQAPITDSLDDILGQPTWSVRSLLQEQKAGSESTTATSPHNLVHLLQLSALPPPAEAEERARMAATLRSQLQFVRDVQSVDTTGTRPLRSIRDETAEGLRRQTIGLEQLKGGLSLENVVGRMKRPRRAKDVIASSEVDGWDPLRSASRKAGRYFVVRSQKTQP